MKVSLFRECSKIIIGCVVTDFLFLLWTAQQKLLPTSIHGVTLATAVVISGLLFDIGLLLIVHRYITHTEIVSMQERSYLWIIGLMFLIVAWVHVVHLFLAIGVSHLLGWGIGIVFVVYCSYTVSLYRETIFAFFARKTAELASVQKVQK